MRSNLFKKKIIINDSENEEFSIQTKELLKNVEEVKEVLFFFVKIIFQICIEIGDIITEDNKIIEELSNEINYASNKLKKIKVRISDIIEIDWSLVICLTLFFMAIFFVIYFLINFLYS